MSVVDITEDQLHNTVRNKVKPVALLSMTGYLEDKELELWGADRRQHFEINSIFITRI